jgi:hypothetical protein
VIVKDAVDRDRVEILCVIRRTNERFHHAVSLAEA